MHSLKVLHCDVKTDNWVIKGNLSADVANYSDNIETFLDRLTICLIDFGKSKIAEMNLPALSIDCLPVHFQKSYFDEFDDTSVSGNMDLSELHFEGSISAKGFICPEMERGDPWTYQVICCKRCCILIYTFFLCISLR